MMVVTGANGHVGVEVVRALVAAGEQVRAVTRDGRSTELPPDVDVVTGDLSDPASLHEAFHGADGAFLLPGYPGVVDAAAMAGVVTVVQLSGTAVETGDNANPITSFMLSAEDEASSDGLLWTIVRPFDFMSNTLRWAPQLAQGDVVREAFAEVPVAMIDPYDIAAVVALCLTRDGHAGKVYTLSGPELLLPADRVRVLGEVLGRPLRLEPLSDDEARASLLADQPAEYADAMMSFYVDHTIDVSHVLPTVEQLLGRPGRSFAEWATQHAAAFAS